MSIAKIVVMGIGGCGSNAVNYVSKQDTLSDLDLVCANTDTHHLDSQIQVEKKLQLGPELLGGLGAGGKVELGRKAAEESMDEIMKFLDNVNMLFLVAGLGKGTGSGATSVVAEAAKQKGILTVAMVVKPFLFEKHKTKIANETIDTLLSVVDSLIVMPNALDKLNENVTAIDAYNYINQLVYKSVKGITDVVTRTGHNNVDFNDMRSVMIESGLTLICQSDDIPKDSHELLIEQAIDNHFFKNIDIKQAKNILVNLTHGEDFEISKVFQIMQQLEEITSETLDSGFVFGEVIDTEMTGKVSLTIILTGMDFLRREAKENTGAFSSVQIANDKDKTDDIDSDTRAESKDITSHNLKKERSKKKVSVDMIESDHIAEDEEFSLASAQTEEIEISKKQKSPLKDGKPNHDDFDLWSLLKRPNS